MLTLNHIPSTGPFARRRVAGASLIEVLVSILLAAVGLLALSGASVGSIRYSKMSQYRGTATLLATDLAERMRANPGDIASYAVNKDFAAQQAPAPVATTACEGYSNTCDSAAMAAYDLANWRFVVRSQLPSGSVFVSTTATGVTPRGADVWVAWVDPAVANSAENNTDSRNLATECPSHFSTDKSVRCSYFRVNI